MEPVWNNIGSQKPLLPTKRKASTEALSPTVVDKGLGHMDPLTNKRPTQLQPMANKFGSQRVQTPKNRSITQELSAKVRNGSSEAIRSKMRETLTAALSVGIQSQEKDCNPNEDNNNNNSAYETGKEHMGSQQADVNKVEDCETSASKNIQDRKFDVQEPQYNYVMPDADSSFGDTFFVKDELLQGNGLSWAWDMEQVQVDEKSNNGFDQGQTNDIDVPENQTKSINFPEELASKVEAELFKLFGGVNKKYKEKGRSLMFNLKDPNNPELREKVLSGAISPERLCSMTPEELASKELSEWRMAKAEELDKMIVLPDSDVDIRRLVKKSHKGEYQVEVEQDDAVSVEVSVGGTSSFTQFQPKKKKTNEEVTDGDKNNSENITIPADGTDIMQELIVDEYKDEGFLPPIVSLDEFMESLNSEPPFENLPVESKESKELKHAADKVNSETGGQTDSGQVSAKTATADTLEIDQPKAKTTEPLVNTKPNVTSVVRKPVPASSAVIGERVWEGELQLTLTSSVSAIGLFRSGEKTSTKEWCSSIEIKGKVRLDAFEKFLQQLPMSRTRAVMVVHFALKDSSSEIHHTMLSEAVDSYVADERLGFGEPVPGVEIYFCPPHTKIIEMLCKHLSKNQNDILKSTDNGLIGVVVWRRPHITLTNSSISSQHKRHKTHNSHSRRHEPISSVTNSTLPKPVNNKIPPQPNNNTNNDNDDEDDDDDVPPGFGPGAAAAGRDEDDLPEFNFTTGQKTSAQVGFGSKGTQSNPSRPVVDQMRQLIYKYGQTANGVVEDDDMPEWQPQLPQKHQPTLQNIQQPVGPHMVNHIMPPPIGPHVNVLQNVVRWPPPPPPPSGSQMMPPNAGVPGQHYGGQWRQDAPRSRGF